MHLTCPLRIDPQSLSTRYDPGTMLLKSGKLPEAVEQFQYALSLTSSLRWYETPVNVARVHHNLANALRMLGDLDAALVHYRRAVDLHSDGGEALFYLNLGSALLELKQPNEAVKVFEQAVKLDPELQGGHNWLAVGYMRLDRLDKAEHHMREALKINPQDWRAWQGLGRILLAQARPDEAVSAFCSAVHIEPNNTQVVQDLGSELVKVDRYAETVDVLDMPNALKDKGILNDLVWLLATCPDDEIRDGSRAVELGAALCPEDETCDPNYLDILAAALAEAGQYARASSVANLALQGARAEGEDKLARAIAERLRLYEGDKPYHEPSNDR